MGSAPQVEGSITLHGLHAPVEVIRDRWGVPHIYAQSLEDVLFAQAFVHAQDRLWQIDVKSLDAPEIVERLLALQPHTNREAAALEQLRKREKPRPGCGRGRRGS